MKKIWRKKYTMILSYGKIVKYEKIIDMFNYYYLELTFINSDNIVKSNFEHVQIISLSYNFLEDKFYPNKSTVIKSEQYKEYIDFIIKKYDLNNKRAGIINNINDLYD